MALAKGKASLGFYHSFPDPELAVKIAGFAFASWIWNFIEIRLSERLRLKDLLPIIKAPSGTIFGYVHG